MLIAIVEFDVSSENRAKALAFLENEAQKVRQLKGNENFLAVADQQSPNRAVIIHEWQDAASFSAYKETEIFAASNAFLKPMMLAAPRSRSFDAALVTT